MNDANTRTGIQSLADAVRYVRESVGVDPEKINDDLDAGVRLIAGLADALRTRRSRCPDDPLTVVSLCASYLGHIDVALGKELGLGLTQTAKELILLEAGVVGPWDFDDDQYGDGLVCEC